MKKYQIAVIGSAGQEEYPSDSYNFKHLYKKSYEVGYKLAKNGCYVITGGKSGIMEGASKGCQGASGISIGFIKGSERKKSNNYVDIEVVTNMGDGGDAFLIPYSADGAIVIGGGSGTLKEVCGFYLQKKPVILLDGTGGWSEKLKDTYLDERRKLQMNACNTPEKAVSVLLSILNGKKY